VEAMMLIEHLPHFLHGGFHACEEHAAELLVAAEIMKTAPARLAGAQDKQERSIIRHEIMRALHVWPFHLTH
jgi:hypothetical protein